MRIKCLHGYFIFQETKVGQVSDFMSRFGLSLTPKGLYYTFEDLIDAPTHSLAGKTLFTSPATVTIEGEPWEIFEANNIVYNFSTGLVVPIASITQLISITQSANKFISQGLILPGSITEDGSRVRDYSAWYSRDTLKFSYSEVVYV